mmetsp:Transcript_15209/g.38694  ORF Transcript_15209/g.38694 Transcript_15209/m.38694 type:complete len:260 (+) Transcript_15209:157-936(+)
MAEICRSRAWGARAPGAYSRPHGGIARVPWGAPEEHDRTSDHLGASLGIAAKEIVAHRRRSQIVVSAAKWLGLWLPGTVVPRPFQSGVSSRGSVHRSGWGRAVRHRGVARTALEALVGLKTPRLCIFASDKIVHFMYCHHVLQRVAGMRRCRGSHGRKKPASRRHKLRRRRRRRRQQLLERRLPSKMCPNQVFCSCSQGRLLPLLLSLLLLSHNLCLCYLSLCVCLCNPQPSLRCKLPSDNHDLRLAQLLLCLGLFRPL